MKCDRSWLRLYAVTDHSWLRGQTLAMQAEAALRGGATMLQLREKDRTHEELLAETAAIQKLCRQFKVPFIINDDVEAAIRCGADGVHVGQGDMEAGNVRKSIGSAMLLGVSAQTAAQALLAEKQGADYLGVGAVFSTSTKPDADTVSMETLGEICRAVTIPVVAIGGIDSGNILRLKGTGVDGVAIVSAIFAQENIEQATRELSALSKELVNP